MSLKKILFKFSLILIVFSTLTAKSFSLEPKDFVQSVVDEASSVLSKNFTKEQKIENGTKEKKIKKRKTTGDTIHCQGKLSWRSTHHFC